MPLREVPVPSRLRHTGNFYKSVMFSQAGPRPVQPLCPGLQILISRLNSAELFRFGIRHRKRLQVETKIFFGSSKKSNQNPIKSKIGFGSKIKRLEILKMRDELWLELRNRPLPPTPPTHFHSHTHTHMHTHTHTHTCVS